MHLKVTILLSMGLRWISQYRTNLMVSRWTNSVRQIS
jgi:hypothetical protein